MDDKPIYVEWCLEKSNKRKTVSRRDRLMHQIFDEDHAFAKFMTTKYFIKEQTWMDRVSFSLTCKMFYQLYESNEELVKNDRMIERRGESILLKYTVFNYQQRT